MLNSGALETDLWLKSLKGVILQSKDDSSSYVSSWKARSRKGDSMKSGSKVN